MPFDGWTRQWAFLHPSKFSLCRRCVSVHMPDWDMGSLGNRCTLRKKLQSLMQASGATLYAGVGDPTATQPQPVMMVKLISGPEHVFERV